MRFPLGINVPQFNYGINVWPSPDLLMCGGSPNLLRIQTTLAAPYVAGSQVMKLTPPNPFTAGETQNGSFITGTGFLCSTAGEIIFTFQATGGSDYLYIKGWSVPAQDVNYPAGTYVNHARQQWASSSHTPADWPVRPELVAGGRRTGWPAGMGKGQAVSVDINSYLGSQAGDWTVQASGTGSIRVTVSTVSGVQTAQVVTVVAGVASGPVVVPSGSHISQVTFIGSSDADPLHDVRMPCPDRPGHADNFAATYAANRSNPDFVLFHPDYINSLKWSSLLRFMGMLQTNDNPFNLGWADRPQRVGIGLGINFTPLEYIAGLANAVGADSWWNVPINSSDDYVRNFAIFLRDTLDPAYKVAVEFSNEIWNTNFDQFYFAGRMNAATFAPWVPQSIAYAAGICTVSMTAHGFVNGVIQVENCTDEAFNGAHAITVIDPDTFTYVPASAPASSPAVARVAQGICCLDPGSQWALPVASMVWDGHDRITVTTTTPHGLGHQDVVMTCNASDPAYNGQWFTTVASPTVFNIFFDGDGYNRPMMPTNPGPGANTVTPKAAQSLRCWKVAYAGGPSGGGLIFIFNQRWIPYRTAQVHRIFHDVFAGQTDRLILVLAWQVPFSPTSWQFDTLIDIYRNQFGGGFLPGCETTLSCAPYFGLAATTRATYLGQGLAISSLVSSGGLATATTAAAHGYATGATVAVANALQPQYCGLFAITVTGTTTFTYPIPAGAATPATVGNSNIPNGIFATLSPPYARELTAVSASGTVLTCTSPGHGWTSGMRVHLCGTGYTRVLLPPQPIFGLFTITVLDADTFRVTFDPTLAPFAIPKATARMWAWDDEALGVLATDLAPLPILADNLAGATATLAKYPGATLRTYENGPTFATGMTHPVGFDISKVMQDSPQMFDIVVDYVTQMYTTYKTTTMNWFLHIFPWSTSGFWGVKEFQHEPNNSKWLALMSLCQGIPDYTDGGGPTATTRPARRWFAGLSRRP